MEACEQLHQIARAGTIRRFPFNREQLPSNGTYVLFESARRHTAGLASFASARTPRGPAPVTEAPRRCPRESCRRDPSAGLLLRVAADRHSASANC